MGLTPISTDYTAANGQNTTLQQQQATKMNFMDTLQYTTSVAGPSIAAGVNMATGGNSFTTTKAGAAVSAAVNAAQGGMGVASMGMSGSPSYLTGGGSMGMGTTASVGSTSTGAMTSNVEGILQETAASQAYLLGIQMEMGNQQTTFTSVSNALNVKHSMMKSVINNFRVG